MADLDRKENSLSVLFTKALESVGVLNKGSADIATGKVSTDEAAESMPVTPPALNVTRVSGLAALIASAGAAALAIFNVDKSEDSTGIVAAAYGSAGLIVAASLVAVAVILYADISARASAAPTTAPSTGAKAKGADAAQATAASVKTSWDEAVKRLETVASGFPRASTRIDFAACWRDASATTGMVSEISVPDDLRDEHSRLLATQGRIVELLKLLISSPSSTGDRDEVADHVLDMRETVNSIAVPASS